jgi:hypothetical protein
MSSLGQRFALILSHPSGQTLAQNHVLMATRQTPELMMAQRFVLIGTQANKCTLLNHQRTLLSALQAFHTIHSANKGGRKKDPKCTPKVFGNQIPASQPANAPKRGG